MRIDKDTIIELIRQYGQSDHVDEARQQLPDQVDTDNEADRGLLQRFGIDPEMLNGLLDKLPGGLKDKLPGIMDKLPGGLGKLL
jgi:hypothetical protein